MLSAELPLTHQENPLLFLCLYHSRLATVSSLSHQNNTNTFFSARTVPGSHPNLHWITNTIIVSSSSNTVPGSQLNHHWTIKAVIFSSPTGAVYGSSLNYHWTNNTIIFSSSSRTVPGSHWTITEPSRQSFPPDRHVPFKAVNWIVTEPSRQYLLYPPVYCAKLATKTSPNHQNKSSSSCPHELFKAHIWTITDSSRWLSSPLPPIPLKALNWVITERWRQKHLLL